ncbi:MAG: TlpA family protein disulfide reductase [Burkholderiaceae bacterium]|nr:TlpA family protein disulfide reductase [Burkholderiaceae bacterium]
MAVAALAGTVAYYTYSQLKARTAQTSAPAPAPAPPASQLAETLPQFQLADRAGEMRSLQDWPDRALIVNFWATWCAPCRREIPLLQQLQRDHEAEGFQVIGIAVDFRDKVLAYADEMQIDYPLLIGEQEALDAAAAFGMTTVGLPFTVFSDRQGRIVTAHLGELTAAEADLILDAVRRVDAGETTPADARVALDAALAALPEPESAED